MKHIVTPEELEVAKFLNILRPCFELQAKTQDDIASDWYTKNWPFRLAYKAELSELVGHMSVWWWCKVDDEADPEQAKLEVVDAMRFAMCYPLQNYLRSDKKLLENWDDFTTLVTDCLNTPTFRKLQKIESLAELIDAVSDIDPSNSHSFGVVAAGLLVIFKKIGGSMEEFANLFLGKSALFAFRRNNGYKQGTYNKMFYKGQEDNVALFDILTNATSTLSFDDIYSQISTLYKEHNKGVKVN